MADADQLLELIEEGIVEHGGDLGGWTRLSEETLQLFDGRVTLRAEVNDNDESETMVHAHVFTTLHDHDDEVLDACLLGMGNDREAALGQAAMIWITCVAGPIRSFLDNKPVCMTCQAGVQGGEPREGFSRGDYGLTGLRAYVGPSIARGFQKNPEVQGALDDAKPWFRFAAEAAAPRRVHVAKVTILSMGEGRWERQLEIDGHDVSYKEPDWAPGVKPREVGYLTRFAVFEFPRNSTEIRRRAELERTIRHFAENFKQYDEVRDLMETMESEGFDPDLVHEVESISTIAFGRAFFERHGVNYASTVIRARRDGRVEMDVPLMSLPAYTRARALAVQLGKTMPEDDFQSLCFYNAESQGLLKALEAAGDKEFDFTQMTFYPLVIPDRGVSDQTFDAALAALDQLVERNRKPAAKKPWWKFW